MSNPAMSHAGRAVILATQEGICRALVHPDGAVGAMERPLRGVALEAVTRDAAGVLYAGSDAGLIYRSRDGGETWAEVFPGFPAARGLWSLVAHPGRTSELYAGLEPVSLWVSRDGGVHWLELTALREHPAAAHWHFYDPVQPHIRAIAFDQAGTQLAIGIEVGGVLISLDGGGSFEDRSHGVDEDVHTIQVAPDHPDHLFAMTGGGLFRSRDGGRRWEQLHRGLERGYLVPLAFVSGSATLCVGAGKTPPPWHTRTADAVIYRSDDGGTHFHMASGPFPLRGMVSAIVADPDNPEALFAGTTDGLLLRSADGGQRWEVAAASLPRIEEMVIAF